MGKLILASMSRYRQQQLAALGLQFSCQPASVDESPLPDEAPADTACRLALYKARSVARANPDAIVIGGDQTGDLNGVLLGKPGDHAAAATQLAAMSGQTVWFHSAIALVQGDDSWQAVVSTEVHMRDLNADEIQRYLLRDTPYDCAGSFKIEQAGTLLMKYVRSEDPSALIGLPLIALANLLRKAGFDPLQ